MSAQLVLSLPAASAGEFRWCWLNAQDHSAAAQGDQQALQSAIAERQQSGIETWLILPGEKLVTRELEYNEKEKKHLRNLLPFQLEDSLIGDVEDIHLSIATPREGKISVAYIDKNWLRDQMTYLRQLGLDVVRCSAQPLVWQKKSANAWLIAFYGEQVHLQYGDDLGFSVAKDHAQYALQLLIAQQKPEHIYLRAADETALQKLQSYLPAECESISQETEIKPWCSDLSIESLDLCQGEFSRRLPIERWWKLWQGVAIFAGVCVLITLIALMIQIRQLNKENLAIRVATETAARSVIPQGKLTNPAKQLDTLLKQLQPTHQQAGMMELLSQSLPVVSEAPNVKIKALNYSQETSELAISLQAKDFAAFERITSALKEKQLQAEILNVNAQGDSQTARLRIHK
jgi:general secretion pathway protein L